MSMVSCRVPNGVLPIVKANTFNERVYQLSHGNSGILLPNLKGYVKYTTPRSHIGIPVYVIVILCIAYTTSISDVGFILSVCNVCVLVWIMSWDSNRYNYVENESQTAAISKLRQVSAKHLDSIFPQIFIRV